MLCTVCSAYSGLSGISWSSVVLSVFHFSPEVNFAALFSQGLLELHCCQNFLGHPHLRLQLLPTLDLPSFLDFPKWISLKLISEIYNTS